MILEITGTGFVNKGAELMLRAILAQKDGVFQDCSFAIERTVANARLTLGSSDLYIKPTLLKGLLSGYPYAESISSVAQVVVPRPIRSYLRWVAEKEIHAVLDASGFRYGDQLGSIPVEQLVADCARWKQQNKVIVMLPQAFGPFRTPKIRDGMQEVLTSVDLVYARDKLSFSYLKELGVCSEKLRIAPDFTGTLNTTVPGDFLRFKEYACVIPNVQMIRQVNTSKAESYISFMRKILDFLEVKNIPYFFLLHENLLDEDVAREILKGREAIEVVREENAEVIRGILGVPKFIISSRFHGLVSGLSQGVPCIATTWSHKYKALMEGYNAEEWMYPVDFPENKLIKSLGRFVSQVPAIHDELVRNYDDLNDRVNNMWNEVAAAIGANC